MITCDPRISFNRTVVLFILFLIPYLFPLQPCAEASAISSRSAAVIDQSTGRLLFGKNPDLKLKMASTTKLMTSLIAMENADVHRIATVSRNASGTLYSGLFSEGDRLTIENLLQAALMQSANDAAVALAESVGGSVGSFVDIMNARAKQIGLRNTRFINPSGLPGEGQYSTAYDLTLLMQKTMTHPTLQRIMESPTGIISTENRRRIHLTNTNKLLFSRNNRVWGKTGYTREAGHCFVGVSDREDHSIIVAVLGAPSRQALWRDIKHLSWFGWNVILARSAPVIVLYEEDATKVPSVITGNRKTLQEGESASEKRGGDY